MRKAVFEVATLADAVSKANRIAPTKGSAADRAAGIVVRVDPSQPEPVLVIATDTEVTIRQNVTPIELGDEAVEWRVASNLFDGILRSLPMTSGSLVSLRDNGDGFLYIICGKKKARLTLFVGNYPIVPRFDPTNLTEVSGLARRLTQVAWAAETKNEGAILTGIHIDGEHIIAHDRANLAMVPCVVKLDEAVTAPLTDIAALLKNTSEVHMRASKNHLELMTDAYTQTTSILYRQEYPPVKRLLSQFKFPHTFMVGVGPLKAALELMLVLVKAERFPKTTLHIGKNKMKLEMEVPQVGKIADEIEIEGGSDELYVTTFSPESLLAAINASGYSKVSMDYGPDPKNSPLRVHDLDGYEAYLAPRASDT